MCQRNRICALKRTSPKGRGVSTGRLPPVDAVLRHGDHPSGRDKKILPVLFGVEADPDLGGDPHILFHDAPVQAGVSADIRPVEEDRILDARIAVDPDGVPEDRAVDLAPGGGPC